MPHKARKFLFPNEFDKLYKALGKKKSVTTQRNKCLVLLLYRHGLRISEALSLQWSDIDTEDQRIRIKRLKNGKPGIHPLSADELIQLAKYKTDLKSKGFLKRYIFINYQSQAPLTRQAAYHIFKEINEMGVLDVHVSPHSLRHSCGYYLANKGHDTRLIQDYLGHKNIANTEIYTELASNRFDAITW